MDKYKLVIPVLAGLFVGHVFAETDRPFTVVNTLRVGYNDNVYRNSENVEESAYIQDIIDLSFRASLSDRTDFVFSSRFDFISDKESNLYPSLYGVLTHSASPRLLLQLSDKFRRGTKTSSSKDGRYDYYVNTLSFVPSYVLSRKDSISAPASYTIKRHEKSVEKLDSDIIAAGLSWKRELVPQRTWAALHFNQAHIDYINRDSFYNSSRVTAELSHTFNPQWQGNVEVGTSFDKSENSASGTNRTVEAANPYVSAGLSYNPTPRTRFSVNVAQRYKESDDVLFVGGTSRTLAFGAQHDFTARITGKATASFVETEYDRQDSANNSVAYSQEYMDLALRLQYKINRIHFVEVGVRRREKSYDTGNSDWDQNMVDVGWRVEL